MDSNTLARLQGAPAAFRDALRLDDGRPWVRDPWQEDFFRALDPGWRRAVGQAATGGYARGWAVRPRGHSKTSDIASMVAWALFAARQPIRGVVAAGDSDQARLVADAVTRIVRANPWLQPFIDVQRGRIVNVHSGSECVILASDAMTSYGLLVDFIICDELTCWRNRELWDSLFSTAAKKPNCLLVVLGNAGIQNTWQHELFNVLRRDRAWHCDTLPGPVASWISPTALEEQRRVLPGIVYQRLWGNEWTTGEASALQHADIERACTLTGPMYGRSLACENAEHDFAAGLDLAVSHDHAALCVLAIHKQTRRRRLAFIRSWAPVGGKIDLTAVEAGVADVNREYRPRVIGFDPYQAELMAQRLTREGLCMQAVPFGGMNTSLMASELVEQFSGGTIEIYRHPPLIRDLQRLQITERQWGLKLEAARTKDGHCDQAIALAIALLVARDMRPPGKMEIAVYRRNDDDAGGRPQTLSGVQRGSLLGARTLADVIRAELDNPFIDGGVRPTFVDTSRPGNESKPEPTRSPFWIW